jgi:hypothetical protein
VVVDCIRCPVEILKVLTERVLLAGRARSPLNATKVNPTIGQQRLQPSVSIFDAMKGRGLRSS